ncbi:MAG: hypothetical protein NUV75_08180 [Gallionella sp.]|nr:hypothetical protein [Gallionella sp.]
MRFIHGGINLLRNLRARSLRWLTVFLLICGVGFAGGKSFAAEPDMSAASLRAKFTELGDQLRNNQFQRPLYLDSAESSHDLKGEIYAVVDYPFAAVNMALNNSAHWCDVLILHLNVKYCHASSNKAGTVLSVNLGRKYFQPLADAYRAEFNYRGLIAMPDYFAVELNAKDGPLSTHDYRIWIEATPLENGRTFLHFTYAYAFGFTGRIAMQGYLATIGRDKVGFTVTGKQPNGQPDYIQGVRGVVERNTMRYYLAIDVYLAALTTPPKERLEKQLQLWYDATEQYARQLHEVERDDYLEMKRKEYQRQQVKR